MSGKLIIHGFDENLAFGGKPIKILIDGKEAGSVSKFEKVIIDIEKDCTLKLKYGLNTSKPTLISEGMLTEVQCRAGADRLHADILTNEPYNPQKDNAEILCDMRGLVTRCKQGEISACTAIGIYDDLREYMFELTPAVESEADALSHELELLCEKENNEAAKEEPTSVVNVSEETTEHRMRCNVCGHIFCYTDKDLAKNTGNAGLGAIAAIGGLASILGGGTIFHTHHLQGQADRYTDKIVDYSRCPSCHSNNISELKDGEAMQQQNSTATSATSPIEEIKKYKELLDMGIITQEEFDTKKKQLLGL